MTIFLVMNSDQSHPYKYDVKNTRNKIPVMPFSFSRTSSEDKVMPPFSPRYEKERALHYQVLHHYFRDSLEFLQIDLRCIKKIENSLNKAIGYIRLEVS